jgi:hypothetical protein
VGAGGAVGFLANGRNAAAQEGEKRATPAQLDPAMVKEWVRVGHFDLDRIQQMYAEEPGLLQASWNLGGDDWETALGAASHVGNRAIAEFLIGKGARMDLFAVTMLGHRAIFDGFLAAYPEAVHWKGPHGLSLLHHAERGGQDEIAAIIRERLAAADR